MVTDEEYPIRVAFSVLNKVTDEFQQTYPKERYESDVTNARSNPANKFKEYDWQTLHTYVQKYQDPKQADTIMKVQQELDETKVVLVRERVCVIVAANPYCSSTKRSSRCWSEGRSSTAWSIALMH